MRTILPSLALGLMAVACSTGQPMESNPTPSQPSPAIQEATFASG